MLQYDMACDMHMRKVITYTCRAGAVVVSLPEVRNCRYDVVCSAEACSAMRMEVEKINAKFALQYAERSHNSWSEIHQQ